MPLLRIRQLRDLMRYCFKMTNFASSKKNRIQNCLTVSNIQLANVLSDTFVRSSMKIIGYLLENPDEKNFSFVSLLPRSMLHIVDNIHLAIDRILTEEQQQKNEYHSLPLQRSKKMQG